ncbi:hypothetical protein B0H19DRAFT_1385676 [Mycena capillaripes]|nr:hypothetical protein B0H19DRAFT_1385676 [Mycena capillaripes]
MATTHFSNALIPWDANTTRAVARRDEITPSQGGWALIRASLLNPTPGRTLGEVYAFVGKALEKRANRAANESARTQCQAFKDIVHLITLFPGLRVLFLRSKVIGSAAASDKISTLWEHCIELSDEEWKFWKILAATCLSDVTISAIPENSTIRELTNCEEGNLSVIERLLIENDCSDSKFTSPLCIRYLGGILDLPGFWLNTGVVHSEVVNKVCRKVVHILKDIGVDILILGPSEEPEPPFDYDGLDFLPLTILNGVTRWSYAIEHDDWLRKPWSEAFRELLQLLRMPRSEALLPNASGCATSTFGDILQTEYSKAEVYIMVDGEELAPETKETVLDAHLTELNCQNDSTSSLDSHSADPQDDSHSLSSVQDSLRDGGAQNDEPDLESMNLQSHSEADSNISSSADCDSEAPGFIPQISNEFSSRLDFTLREDTAYGPDIYGGSEDQKSELREISRVADKTSVPPWKILQMQAEDLKITVQKNQGELGDGHADTLHAMGELVWTYYGLGQFKEAADLRVVLLERQRESLGEDHEVTFRTTVDLGATYGRLGLFNKAQQLQLMSLEKQAKVLGEDHADTLQTMGSLASTYHNLGQYTRAEELKVEVLQKRRKILGEDHPDTLSALGSLALAYHYLSQYSKAEDLEAEVSQKQTKILEEDHPHTLHTMGSVASTYYDFGQHTQTAQTERLEVELLQKQMKIVGEDHPHTLHTMGNLALTYRTLGQYNQAEELGIKVLQKRRWILGEDHPYTLDTKEFLAGIYYCQCRFRKAEELQFTVLAKGREVLGDDHPDTGRVMSSLASTFRRLDKVREAEELESLIQEQQM